MALFALSLARSLAMALICEGSLPAQALSSPRRSSLRLNSVAVSSTQKSVAKADLIPELRGAAESATTVSASDPIFMAAGVLAPNVACRILQFTARELRVHRSGVGNP
jgi:hypothetical protein